jgi:neutral amino acid transport system ATP-binding protein
VTTDLRTEIIKAEGVTKRFGGLVAVDRVDYSLREYEVAGIIGSNGAGKTTFFNLLTGFDEPDNGRWVFDGAEMNGIAAYKTARLGMVRTFQLTKALTRLSVIENMKLGATDQGGENVFRGLLKPLWRAKEKEIEAKAEGLLERFRLLHMRDEFAGNLSGGQRKLLEMARALMADPRLIMLDEPMAGVNPALTQSLLGHVKSLRDEGRTVIFVEHDMDVVRDISDWVVVMAEGSIIAEGPPSSVGANQQVIDAYLGAHHDMDLGPGDG